MTITLNLSSYEYPDERIFIEFKGPPERYDDVLFNPVCTLWHEVDPGFYQNVFHILNWVDNLNGILDYCDDILLNMTRGTWPGYIGWYHVDGVSNDLILREKIMDPICTWWHEVYPEYCTWRHITSWEDIGYPYEQLSPGDQIDMTDEYGNVTWYFVDRVTLTINVTLGPDFREWMKIELKTLEFEEMYNALKHPNNTRWHEIYPHYCNVYQLIWWDPMNQTMENCNGVLDVCDYIFLENQTGGEILYCHVEDICYDLILNEKITDPTCTYWHELYPECCVYDYHIEDWEDTGEPFKLLSPSDHVTMSVTPTGYTDRYHVNDITLTLNLTILDWMGPAPPDPRIYLEFTGDYPDMYYPKIYPWDTEWLEVCPIFGEVYYITDWWDNCNGVLSFCDYLELYSPNLMQYLYCHIEEVAVDMIVEVVGPEPTEPWYIKSPYPDYAISGMPDFDQKQDGWFHPDAGWTWCGPTAVGDSIWWFDSEYESLYNPSPVPPPTISDSFGLVTNWGNPWDDHHPKNVGPLITNLAFLMDTDGIRTGLYHTGTFFWDMETGISQYLQQQGINPVGDCDGDGDVDGNDITIINNAMGTVPGAPGWNMAADVVINNIIDINDLNAALANVGQTGMFYEHTVEFPEFHWIEEEIYRCQDVVLLLEFWQDLGGGEWERWWYDPGGEGGHYVTCAGVNSTTFELLLSDPWTDAYEAGYVPGRNPVPCPTPHTSATHNDTQYVSHDAYLASLHPSPYGMPLWELIPYPWAAMGFDPSWHAFIRAAVVTSPIAHDVAVTDIHTVCCNDYSVQIDKTVVCHNQSTCINVTVTNQGSYSETTNVALWAQNVSTYKISATVPVSLLAGESKEVTFTFDSTGLPIAKYLIFANATSVVGETDTVDNTYSDGFINVAFQGDIDLTGHVFLYDLTIVGTAWDSYPGDTNWDANADIDGDCWVFLYDLTIVGTYWDEYAP
jgi:hypothetical protein